jgi:cytochrome c biogenesis protein CcmG/thiol:disulfide interchange protein DsbE
VGPEPTTPSPLPGIGAPRRRPIVPIAILLLVAAATAAVVLLVARGGPAPTTGDVIAKGQPVPNVAGATLDGGTLDLAALRGHPVLVNFWGPSCEPCRQEMPLIAQKVAQHAADGLVVVGVLTDDPVEPARTFEKEFGATWQTVIDPNGAIKQAYRVLNRPQSYFVDAKGILRSIQIGYLTDADFERQLALTLSGT